MRSNDHYRVKLCVQQFRNSPIETFHAETLASSPEEAESNIRERFRDAYALSINTVKRGI